MGTAAAEVFVGGDGNDIMAGNGGADVLRGGAGDDQLTVLNAGFMRVAGGAGSDRFQMEGAFDLDLTVDVPRNAISGIEEIFFNGFGGNTLALDVSNVIGVTEGANLKPDDAQFQTVNTLVVTGDNFDTLDIDLGAGGFSDTGLDTTVDGQAGYSVFDHATSNARIVVEDEISVI